jgi:hypothetical protein
LTEEHESDKQNKKEIPKDFPVFKSARRVSIAAADLKNENENPPPPPSPPPSPIPPPPPPQQPREKVEAQEK